MLRGQFSGITDSTDEQAGDEVPGLLEVLAGVPDTRRKQGRRFALVLMLAAAVACVLAGAKTFREIGDQAADLPQGVSGGWAAGRTRCCGGSSRPARSGSAP